MVTVDMGPAAAKRVFPPMHCHNGLLLPNEGLPYPHSGA